MAGRQTAALHRRCSGNQDGIRRDRIKAPSWEKPEIVRTVAEKLDYEVKITDKADAFAEIYESFNPNVIVLDLVMPDLDGLGVLARLRESGNNVPVIVQTAHGGIDNVVSAMRAGAVDFVVKPVGAERLQVLGAAAQTVEQRPCLRPRHP